MLDRWVLFFPYCRWRAEVWEREACLPGVGKITYCWFLNQYFIADWKKISWKDSISRADTWSHHTNSAAEHWWSMDRPDSGYFLTELLLHSGGLFLVIFLTTSSLVPKNSQHITSILHCSVLFLIFPRSFLLKLNNGVLLSVCWGKCVMDGSSLPHGCQHHFPSTRSPPPNLPSVLFFFLVN